MKRTLVRLGLLLSLLAPAASATERIVALGSCVTEMLFALGEGAQVAAVDSSSNWPPAVRALPQVGYQRLLAAEGILALSPTLVLGTTQAGPKETLEQLRRVGVEVRLLPAPQSLQAALDTMQAIADLRGKPEQGRRIVGDLRRRLDAARAQRPPGSGPRVLALMAAGTGLMVAGRDTAADLMITLAGASNAAAALQGYKPLTAETLLGMQPDAILVPDHALRHLQGPEALLRLPGLAETPAARAARVVVMESQLLLGLGPRLGQAVETLGAALNAPAKLTAHR